MYDIAIVGAGILGATAAYEAAKQQKKVLLIEQGHQPNGATVRNFGQVIPSGLSGIWRELGYESLEIYKELESLLIVRPQKYGSLYVASDALELELLHERYALDKGTHNVRMFDTEKCLRYLPHLKPDYVRGGLHYDDDLTIDSPVFMQSFIGYLAQHPLIDYRPSTQVVDVEQKSSACALRFSSADKLHATDVLLCCGHHLGQLFPDELQTSDTRICKLQMMELQLNQQATIPGNLLTGNSIRRYAAFADCESYEKTHLQSSTELDRYGIHLLVKQNANGRLVIGDSHEYFPADTSASTDYRINQHINQLIMEQFDKVLNITDVEIAECWNGYYSEHNEGALLRQLDSHIHCVTGLGGKGMTAGPALMKRAIHEVLAGNSIGELIQTTPLVASAL